MSYLKVKRGWAVQIERKDGSTFLASSGVTRLRGWKRRTWTSTGNLPAIWVKSNRKAALLHKQDCLLEGFKCRIVPVKYSDPVVVVEKPKPKCVCGHSKKMHRAMTGCKAVRCDCVGYRWRHT